VVTKPSLGSIVAMVRFYTILYYASGSRFHLTDMLENYYFAISDPAYLKLQLKKAGVLYTVDLISA